MENPLKYFKELIEGHDILFLKQSFTQNPSYRPEDETIFEVISDPFANEPKEVRLSYKQYLSNQVSSGTTIAIKQLDSIVHKSANEDDYLSKVEGEIAYLLKRLTKASDEVTCEVVSKGLEKVKSHINERYREQPVDITKEKIVWKGNPAIFFMLFQELHTRGFIGTASKKDSLAKLSRLLYEMVEVPPLNNKKTGYTISSFEQNFKPSGGLQDYPNYLDLKVTIERLVKDLKDQEKTL